MSSYGRKQDREERHGNLAKGLATGACVLAGLYVGNKAYERHNERKRREEEDHYDEVWDYDYDYYRR